MDARRRLSELMVERRDGRQCVCGHFDEAHRHYRAGTDCSRCECPKFQWRLLSWVPRTVTYPPRPGWQ